MNPIKILAITILIICLNGCDWDEYDIKCLDEIAHEVCTQENYTYGKTDRSDYDSTKINRLLLIDGLPIIECFPERTICDNTRYFGCKEPNPTNQLKFRHDEIEPCVIK